MKKKQLKRELRALAESHRQLERAHRQLATHTQVIAIAVHSPAIVPASDLQDAVTGIHDLTARFAAEKSPQPLTPAA